MDTLRLEMLPTEMLVIIFNYCDLYDLARLDQVCKRFHNIIRSNVVWKRHDKNFLVTNQVSEQFRQRCNLLLPSHSKYFISQNWIRGCYQERILLRLLDLDYSQLQLTSDKLWWMSDRIFGCDRQETTHQKPNIVSCDRTFLEIEEERKPMDFILWRDYIVTNHSDGSITWLAESPVKNKYNGCYECVIKKRLNIHTKKNYLYKALDATSNVIFSASDSQYAIIRVENSLDVDSINNDNIVRKEIPEYYIENLASHPLGTILSAILVSKQNPDICHICHIDVEQTFSNSEIMRITNQDVMPDIFWEDPNTLLMRGIYGIHKYDFRSRVNDYVSTWRFPEHEWMNCISSDHHNTMITGGNYSKAFLWDHRMPNFVQIYYLPPAFEVNKNPDSVRMIFSLQFDSTRLYCSMKNYIYELDFSKRGCSVRDYRSDLV